MILLILAAAVMAGTFIRWAVINDNLTALEDLDDESVAAAIEEWSA